MEASPTLIFWSCFSFGFVTFLWELYLSWRQYRKQRDTVERPDYLSEIIDEESFKKARSYKLDCARFGFALNIWSAFENSTVLLFELIVIFWAISGHIINSWGYSNEILHSLVFIAVTTIIDKVINLPWKLYHTFVIEEKHGFNKQTYGFFAKDQLKKLVLYLLIGLPITAALLWIIQIGGDYFFIFVWIFFLFVTFFLMTIYPEFIAPLFDKYRPLPDGDLRSKIEELASRLKFPLKKLYVVEGSKRSAHSNAYLYGFWNNKRIVLYDTLLANYSPLNEDGKEKQNGDNSKQQDTVGEKQEDIVGARQRGGDDDKDSVGKQDTPNGSETNDWEKPNLNDLSNEGESKDAEPKGEIIDTVQDVKESVAAAGDKPSTDTEESALLKPDAEESTHAEKSVPAKESASAEEKGKEKKKLGTSDDEVVAVIGHELGHWSLNHTALNIVISEVNMLLCLTLFSLLYKWPALYEAFGFTKSQPTLIGLFLIFGFVFAPYNEVLGFFMTWWGRHCEFAADRFSAELGYARLLKSALVKLSKDNLDFPVQDWLYSAWHHSHPPTAERVEALKKFD